MKNFLILFVFLSYSWDGAFHGGKPCFLENGKPVVKQGRKAMGPPLAKADRQAADRKSP